MTLTTDGEQVTQDPQETDLAAALARLRRQGKGRVELRQDRERWLAAENRGARGWFLEVQQRGGLLFGLACDAARAESALGEFLEGFTPRLPWKALKASLPPGVMSLKLGDDYDDGCPLCRLGL